MTEIVLDLTTWTRPAFVNMSYGNLGFNPTTADRWLVVSGPITIAPDQIVSLTAAGPIDVHGNALDFNLFIADGANVAVPATGTVGTPTVSGTTTVLGYGSNSLPATTATIQVENGVSTTIHLGAWIAGELHGMITNFVASSDPAPTPPAPAGLGVRVAAFLGRAGDQETIDQADAHASIVTEYVYGYTRGRGFITYSNAPDEYERGIESVIISATARLTGNPEQVSYYAAGDYSERPAVLAGWTLPERAVLNRYRRRTA